MNSCVRSEFIYSSFEKHLWFATVKYLSCIRNNSEKYCDTRTIFANASTKFFCGYKLCTTNVVGTPKLNKRNGKNIKTSIKAVRNL